MPSALQMVRETLGEDAIILSSTPNKGKRGITVTAAVDKPEEPPAPAKTFEIRPDHAAAEQLRHDIVSVLRFHNLPELFIGKIMRRPLDQELASVMDLHKTSARGGKTRLLELAMEHVLASFFGFAPLQLEDSAARIMLLGPPGIGKTLTIAKMAAQMSLGGKNPNLAVFTTDTKRAGGIEQLQAFTSILNIDLQIAQSPQELQQKIQALPPRTQILVDTAGCNAYDTAEREEFKSLAALKGIEPVLVMPAGGDSLEAIDIMERFSSTPIKRLLITRADTARRFGGLLAIAGAYGLSFSNMSSSSSIIDTLQPMNGAKLAQLLLRYQLQSPST